MQFSAGHWRTYSVTSHLRTLAWIGHSLLNDPLSSVRPFQDKAGQASGHFLRALLLYANIAGVISSTWMITSAGMSLRRAAFLIASALSAS